MKPLQRREFLLLATTGMVVALFVVGSWFVFERIADNHRANARAALETVLDTTRQAFLTWAREERASARIWAQTPELIELTEELLRQAPTPEALLAIPQQDAVRRLLQRVQSTKGYEGFFIIAPDGISLSSSRDENIGIANLLMEQPDVLARLLAGSTVLSLPQRSDVPLIDEHGNPEQGRPTMFVGAPVLGANGAPIAALVFRLNPFLDFTAIFQRGRLGITGETYAIDARGQLISESRFDDQLREIGLIGEGELALLNIDVRDP